MLGKQGLKFLTSTNTFVSKLFRSKYYLGGDFLNVSLGYNPGFTWRIWAYRDVVENGYRWRVGNGNLINVWNDPWLRDELNFNLQKDMPLRLQFL